MLHNFIYSTEHGYGIHSAGELKIWKSTAKYSVLNMLHICFNPRHWILLRFGNISCNETILGCVVKQMCIYINLL